MTQEAFYTIGQLAQAAGLTPRTIRYYTAEGLLPAPDTRGRYARYSHEHLSRLRLIHHMKSAYLPLTVIRERLNSLTTAEIEAQLSVDTPAGMERQEPLAILQLATTVLPSETSRPRPAMLLEAPREPFPPRASGRRRILLISPRLAGLPSTLPWEELSPSDSPRRAELTTETWKRIVLAPGVELHLHVPESPEAGERLNRIIAEVQALFQSQV